MFSCELSILLSTECPPVLFEMSYFENGVQIGGNPWQYIYTPNHKRHIGTHHICSFTDGALVNTLITLRYSLENQSYKKSQAATYLECWHAVRVNVCLLPACCILVKLLSFVVDIILNSWGDARQMILGLSFMLLIKLLHSKSMNILRLWY